jgi:hypothetical protein
VCLLAYLNGSSEAHTVVLDAVSGNVLSDETIFEGEVRTLAPDLYEGGPEIGVVDEQGELRWNRSTTAVYGGAKVSPDYGDSIQLADGRYIGSLGRAGSAGALAPVVAFSTGPDGLPDNRAYFWMTGLLSSFLDNAPTYLVFFNMAGGDPQALMGPLWDTLLAISAGSVFMGAMTYIGNAPNFMVRSIASERGIRMPSFLGYMGWSGAVLLPTFALVTVVFFRS